MGQDLQAWNGHDTVYDMTPTMDMTVVGHQGSFQLGCHCTGDTCNSLQTSRIHSQMMYFLNETERTADAPWSEAIMTSARCTWPTFVMVSRALFTVVTTLSLVLLLQ